MVEPINTSQGRIRSLKAGDDVGLSQAGTNPASVPATPAAARASGDSLTLSASAQAVPAELKEAGPPMDLEIVQRIKDAIAEGKYPIDLEKITESLFRDYLELMG